MDPEEADREREIRPGVRELDHTADLGIRIVAATREELFERAARGMFALMWGDEEVGGTPVRGEPGHPPAADESSPGRAGEGRGIEERCIELRADEIDTLLARWLQELLYLYDVHSLVPTDVQFESLADSRLTARVGLAPAGSPPARELKGVTYHGLEVERPGSEWRGQVIFDI